MPIPLSKNVLDRLNKADSKFNLDISGVAGFFGGDVAVSAMGTIHLYRHRRWLGWYNSPGSYEIAKNYGVLCRARLWDALYPGVNVDPAVLFGLNDKEGPAYRGVHSRTALTKTGHLGYLLMGECEELPVPPKQELMDGRRSSVTSVTVVDLHNVPAEYNVRPAVDDVVPTVLAVIPILITLAAAVLCIIIAEDWFSFSLILFGALVSGASSIVIGSGKLELSRPEPAEGSPSGDGVLGAGGSHFIVLLGPEHATNIITKGAFRLQFDGEPQYHMIGICALFLTFQFLAQLLIIPVGTIFGQLMFLVSLAASWIYSAFLSSIDRESLQCKIVNRQVLKKPQKLKYVLGTRTMAVAFTLRVLRDSFDQDQEESQKGDADAKVRGALEKLLDEMLPNDTPDWRVWKESILGCIINRDPDLKTSALEENSSLLKTLFSDSRDGLRLFNDVHLKM